MLVHPPCWIVQHLSFGRAFRQFSFKVMHRIITIKKELLNHKLASDDKCSFCFNPDSIVQSFIHCQESNEFFSKNLGCFNDYHKENVNLSNKQNSFNTFEDSFTLQMSNSVPLNRLRLLVLLQRNTCVSFWNNVALKVVANKSKCVATDTLLFSNTFCF